MRRIVIVFSSTITAIVLLLSYPTSLNRGGFFPGAVGASGTTPVGATTSTTTGAATAAGSTAATTTGKSGTYTGKSASTRYGNVQVKITVAGGKITAAQAVAYPNQDGHSAQISAYAIPTLNQEAVAGQSAKISMVGGATYTSTGYLQSLQSALDQAGL